MLNFDFISKLLFMFLRVRSGDLGVAGSFPPPLTAERERECFAHYKDSGDTEARAELIEHNLRLVAHIVKKYAVGRNQDDLISIGTIGLIKAVDSFDPHLGARFATYAGKCIANAILL